MKSPLVCACKSLFLWMKWMNKAKQTIEKNVGMIGAERNPQFLWHLHLELEIFYFDWDHDTLTLRTTPNWLWLLMSNFQSNRTETDYVIEEEKKFNLITTQSHRTHHKIFVSKLKLKEISCFKRILFDSRTAHTIVLADDVLKDS